MDCNRIMAGTNYALELNIYLSLKIMNTVASRARWIFVYYFVIMVRNLKIKLQAEDHQTLGRRLAYQRKKNYTMLIIFVLCQTIIVVLNIIYYLDIFKNQPAK